MHVANMISQFCQNLRLENISSNLIDIAKTGLIDTIGVMIAGSKEPATRIALDLAAVEKASGTVSVIGQDFKTSTQTAALINGISTQALDYDLSFMSGQSTAPLVPALLPVAQTIDATPQNMLRAYIIGTEVSARLIQSCPELSSDPAWHGSNVFGTIAATAAIAALANQPATVCENALGINASMSSGVGANFGTMTKPLHTGLAARNSVLAIALAERKFTANPGAIESRNGFYDAFARERAVDYSCFEDLGSRYYLEDPGYKIKPFACGGVLHCAIEAALRLHSTASKRPTEISRIIIGVTERTKKRALDDYPWDEDSSRFSPRFLIPYTLTFGAPTLSAFSETAFDNALLRQLATLCDIVVEPELTAATPASFSPSRVSILFSDGQQVDETVLRPTGTRDTPMSDEQLKAKFLECASEVYSPEAAADLYDYLSAFETHKSMGTLWKLLNE